jgi:hypothetical protein
VRVKRNVIEAGFGRLVQAVEQGVLAPADVQSGYNLAVYDLLSREILRELPQLAERIAWRIAQIESPAATRAG